MDSTAAVSDQLFTSRDIIVALLASISTIVIAFVSSHLTYRYTRRVRLESEWRADKLKKYEELLRELVQARVNLHDRKDRMSIPLVSAINTISLVAPVSVTNALDNVVQAYFEVKKGRKFMTTYQGHELITDLVLAMSADLKIDSEGLGPDALPFLIWEDDKNEKDSK